MIPPIKIDEHILSLIKMAAREDLGGEPRTTSPKRGHDLTVEISIPENSRSTGRIIVKKEGVIAGSFLLESILREYAPGMQITLAATDGSHLMPGDEVATVSGPTRALLSAERVLLNFLGRLSGIATQTRRYVKAAAQANSATQICDTRKTTPGYRTLEKYAVACGGGVNHRMGLYDGAMLKDNHLAALRQQLGKGQTLAQLTKYVKNAMPSGTTLWLEVDTLAQLREALPDGGADVILLDNMTPDQTAQAVKIRNDHSGPDRRYPQLESSGGITIDNIAHYAATGVERISIGALTHSAIALDVSMEFA